VTGRREEHTLGQQLDMSLDLFQDAELRTMHGPAPETGIQGPQRRWHAKALTSALGLLQPLLTQA
jgi:hypothetical protein